MGGAISAWVADECNRIAGQKSTLEEEAARADSEEAGKLRELEAWRKIDVFPPDAACKVQKQIAQTRRVLTWEMAEGEKRVKAQLVAKRSQNPDLKEGLADTSGCLSLRSSHLQVIPLSAIR